MNYFKKYLKYKNKYLELKGGSSGSRDKTYVTPVGIESIQSIQIPNEYPIEYFENIFDLANYTASNKKLFASRRDNTIYRISQIEIYDDITLNGIISSFSDNKFFTMNLVIHEFVTLNNNELLLLLNKIIKKELKSLTIYNSITENDFRHIVELTSLQTLTLGNNFNQSIEPLARLTQLQTLNFGNNFNQSIEPLASLNQLQTLTFGDNFNQPIEPLASLNQLQTLTFGDNFNQPIEPLAGLTQLQTLTFGNNFNQPIELLQGLTKLRELFISYTYGLPIPTQLTEYIHYDGDIYDDYERDIEEMQYRQLFKHSY